MLTKNNMKPLSGRPKMDREKAKKSWEQSKKSSNLLDKFAYKGDAEHKASKVTSEGGGKSAQQQEIPVMDEGTVVNLEEKVVNLGKKFGLKANEGKIQQREEGKGKGFGLFLVKDKSKRLFSTPIQRIQII